MYKMSLHLCLTAVSNDVVIERQKYSKLKIIHSHFDDITDDEKLFNEESLYVRNMDILDIMIDLDQSSQCMQEYLDIADLEGEENIIIALLIMDNRFNLTERYIKQYNPVFTKIAIESDNFDIAIMLKTMYPIQFTVNEKLYLDSVITSIQKTN